jgi:hypothetical protein
MKISVCLERIFIGMALMLMLFVGTAHAEMASIYGGRDGYLPHTCSHQAFVQLNQ